MTWLDWFVRQRAELARTRRLAEGRPLSRTIGGAEDAFAAFSEEVQAVANGSDASSSRAHALFCRCLAPFLQGFLPNALRGQDPGPALGLVLTRETADLLSDAGPPATDAWRQRVFGARPDGDCLGAVYVDVPHGALRLEGALQLRALLAVPWTEQSGAGGEARSRDEMILVSMVITALGSERPQGILFGAVDVDGVLGVTLPDNTLVGFLHADTAAPDVQAGEVPAELYSLVLERAVRFLRLSLAFHRYGPAETRSAVGVTPADTAVKNRNRPRKGESIFAMVRLSAPAGRLGRPPRASSAGWPLTARQEVSGHFKLQPHGPGGSLRRLIWVDAYERGPDDAAVRPRAVRL